MADNYFFVDGSSLLSDIARFRRELEILPTSRFHVPMFWEHFTGENFRPWHAGDFRRFVIYFADGDPRVETDLFIPDPVVPGAYNDTRIEYCGKRLRDMEKAREWLDTKNAPPFVTECLYRSEKAVDTQICCDALDLVRSRKIDRLFLYTNDYDFIPLCRTLRRAGVNVSLFRFDKERTNKELAAECDAFHVCQYLPMGYFTHPQTAKIKAAHDAELARAAVAAKTSAEPAEQATG